MMADPRLSPGFAELEAEWYGKLEASGFRDVEPAGKPLFMREHHLETAKKVRDGWRTGAWVFYEVWQRWVLSRAWPSRSARLAAACMAEGVSAAEIPSLLPRCPKGLHKLAGEWKIEMLEWNRDHE